MWCTHSENIFACFREERRKTWIENSSRAYYPHAKNVWACNYSYFRSGLEYRLWSFECGMGTSILQTEIPTVKIMAENVVLTCTCTSVRMVSWLWYEIKANWLVGSTGSLAASDKGFVGGESECETMMNLQCLFECVNFISCVMFELAQGC